MSAIKQVTKVAMDTIHCTWNCIYLQLLQLHCNYVITIFMQLRYNYVVTT